MDHREEAILGCIVGGALGDAFGEAYEGLQDAAEPNAERPWRLTDDTQLTLATCEAIVAAGKVDPATIGAVFADKWRRRLITGAGASITKALTELAAGGHWALVGRRGDMAAGNGAAMRVAPLAFLLDPTLPDDRTVLRDVCRITHHSDEAYCGALAVLWANRLAYRREWPGKSADLVGTVADHLPDCGVRDRLRAFAIDSPTIAAAAAKYGAGGHVVQSVPLAILAAQSIHALGFVATLKKLIEVGGDTDTNASIAGQIAGAYLGYASLPQEWIDRLPDHHLLVDGVRQFASVAITS